MNTKTISVFAYLLVPLFQRIIIVNSHFLTCRNVGVFNFMNLIKQKHRPWFPARTSALTITVSSLVLDLEDMALAMVLMVLALFMSLVSISYHIISHNICYGANQPELSSASHN